MRLSTYFVAGSMILLTGCQSVNSTSYTSIKTDTLPHKKIEQPKISKAIIKPEPIVIEDVWERIRVNMHMPIPNKKLVNQYRDWYINNPRHLALVSERAKPFLFLIVDKIEKRNLPIELALLPIVESSFDPFAYSHGAASGLWQFTTPMAKHFGLEMNWWYDGRRDVAAATDAALDMMQYLYAKTDNNWLYAIAAYNTGEGRVINAVKRNRKKGKKTDFWSLNLPKETERYVPQLLALADVIKNADKYGIKLAPIMNKPAVEIIEIGSQIDLAKAANMANLSITELHRLNPGYNRWATSPTGPNNLVIPSEHAKNFKSELSKSDPHKRLNWLRYKIKAGDNIGVIAQKYDTTVNVLKSVNELSGNLIYEGQYLLIPVAAKDLSAYSLSEEQRLLRKQNRKRANYRFEHKVLPGDSLWKIAKENNIQARQLAAWNNMAPKDPLQIGQKLVIWTNKVSNKQSATAVMRTVYYKVKNGDSISVIANKFNIHIHDVIRWNSLEHQKYLKPGQTLKLFVDVTQMNI